MTVLEFINQAWTYIIDVFKTPIADVTIYNAILIMAIVGVCFFAVKQLLRMCAVTIKKAFGCVKGARGIYKKKCDNIQCKTCGRTLTNCVCQKNNKKSCFSRYRLYRRENRK